jgi:hypothetical protein
MSLSERRGNFTPPQKTVVDIALADLPSTQECNWMTVSNKILPMLSKMELVELLRRLITNRGVDEHEHFYEKLGNVCGLDRAAELIIKASQK